MSILKEEDQQEIRKVFADLVDPVTLVLFTKDEGGEPCAITREIVEELATLSDKLSAEICDLEQDAARAAQHGVELVPTIIVLGAQDQGIRFVGVPAGYEFTTLVETILDVSKGEHGLPDDIVAELAKVDQPVHLQVLITPT